ncbi:hypothetical protein BdWA1_001926 [Babesia duncani]|uniref:Uncharacterized protein n=1 Tax=Babesia duncani TaxID=323732 RepID=A0AAD9UPA3_9APIC|nr:hypothetical protein BdWA1_001926 [Babesia duncani]
MTVRNITCMHCHGLGWLRAPLCLNPPHEKNPREFEAESGEWLALMNRLYNENAVIHKPIPTVKQIINSNNDCDIKKVQVGQHEIISEIFFTSYNFNEVKDDEDDSESPLFTLLGANAETIDTVFDSVVDFVICDETSETPYTFHEQVLQFLDDIPDDPAPEENLAVPGTIHKKGLGLIQQSPENDTDETWHPGFTRQLGSKGRCAILELLRKVYRKNPPYYKEILKSRTPPASISNLPFFNIPMLWELAYQFGIFQQALQISRNYQMSVARSKRGLGTFSNSESIRPLDRSLKSLTRDVPKPPAQFGEYETKTQSGRFIKKSKRYSEYATETPTKTINIQENDSHVFLSNSTSNITTPHTEMANNKDQMYTMGSLSSVSLSTPQGNQCDVALW